MSALVPVPFEFFRNELRKRDTMRGLPSILSYLFSQCNVNSIVQEHECYMTHKTILAQRGSYMSALVPVPFEFFRNELRKRDTMRGLPSILSY